MMRATGIAALLLLASCAIEDTGKSVAVLNELNCYWHQEREICLCVATYRGGQGYMTWVPRHACGQEPED